ncbi:uncharacterized protein METZ01_LOCUS505472, partial [marine metagenome]
MAATGYSVAAAAAFGASIVAAGSALVSRGLKKVLGKEINFPSSIADRTITNRSAIAPQKLIFGECVVSGPITFVGSAGTNNRDLSHVIALAGHECNAILDIYLDD